MAVEMFTSLLVGLFILSLASAESCLKPQVDSQVYSTHDAAVVVSTALVTEFTLKCSNGAKNLPLYAEINGRTTPVTKSEDGTKYQVSWVGEHKLAPRNVYPIRVFDSEGYQQLKKAQRNEENVGNVKPLFTIELNHPGQYRGPWLQSEFVAAIGAILVWYIAYSEKAKIHA
ncbi:PREDICTED: translocon-associated protein subunit delta-like [Priapulus caudatus]|uniref:Translocon-associated protein subunit delta n=1 Tax=Priapulus caudatus TaxID=37621 RepID=A0ABM1DUS3_PRICU|nr:PREDICTED: translocon-associated protein subunit delta-like [Priapulus caudatus]